MYSSFVFIYSVSFGLTFCHLSLRRIDVFIVQFIENCFGFRGHHRRCSRRDVEIHPQHLMHRSAQIHRSGSLWDLINTGQVEHTRCFCCYWCWCWCHCSISLINVLQETVFHACVNRSIFVAIHLQYVALCQIALWIFTWTRFWAVTFKVAFAATGSYYQRL